MIYAVSSVALLAIVGLVVLYRFYAQTKRNLSRYSQIQDIEAYQNQCLESTKNAEQYFTQLTIQSRELTALIESQKTKSDKFQQVLGKFKNAAELHQRIADYTVRVQAIHTEHADLTQIVSHAEHIKSQEAIIQQKKADLESFSHAIGGARTVAELSELSKRYEQRITHFKTTLGLLEKSVELQEFIKAQEAAIQQKKSDLESYSKAIGTARSITELSTLATKYNQHITQLKSSLGLLNKGVELQEYIKSQEASIQQRNADLDSMSHAIGYARKVSEIVPQVTYYQNYLAQLKADVEAVEEAKSLQEFGFYRPRYSFQSSDLYQSRLEQIRNRQKNMLSDKSACVCATEWTVEGSKAEGKKMVNQQIKLMLRAFNGECDAAVAKVKFNNATSLENRIRRSFEAINKLGETKRIYMSPDFCNLKFEELFLAHEYEQKREEEREEQRAIREQMREEQKVAKEIEKACELAERDEELKMQALERARKELAEKEGQQTAKLESLVQRLENELKEALDRKAKAIARAQLTKSGHVYVLSNIGTFGEGVYKIGMSRRLEPLERVDELGGASVPFPFDVHAMIYSENAPELEAALHRSFSERRVNMVNLRREFFHVSLDEIRAMVSKLHGQITFVLEPEAEQYRQTVALRKTAADTAPVLQIA